MISLAAASTDPFDLLDRVDSAGGIVFSGEPLDPGRPLSPLIPATTDDIAARIEKISTDDGISWWPEGREPGRFSLAGTQGKFSLARFEGEWFWPNADLPSTHIVKPAKLGLPGVPEVEDASMWLASASGAAAARHSLITFGAEVPAAYIVTRFDRRLSPDGISERIKCEDLLQAMGRSRESKYDLEVGEILSFLLDRDPTEGLPWAWLRQLMARYSIGDGDAQAKNFSVFIGGAAPEMSPMYDVIATGSWPGAFDRGLPIPLMNSYGGDGCFLPEYLTPKAWAEEAAAAGMDGGRAADMSRRVSGLVLASLDRAADMVPRYLAGPFAESVRAANRRAEPIAPDELADPLDRDGAEVPEISSGSEGRDGPHDCSRVL